MGDKSSLEARIRRYAAAFDELLPSQSRPQRLVSNVSAPTTSHRPSFIVSLALAGGILLFAGVAAGIRLGSVSEQNRPSSLSYVPGIAVPAGPIEIGSSTNNTVLRMVTPQGGWAIGPPGKGANVIHDAVLITADGGEHWRNVTPPGFHGQGEVTTYFLDMQHAWVAVAPSLGDRVSPATVTVFRTSDGAYSWQTSTFEVLNGAPAQLNFADSQHGWMMLQTSAPNGTGGVAAYGTRNGGLSWEAISLPSIVLPSGPTDSVPLGPSATESSCDFIPFQALSFANATTGWAAGECLQGPVRVFLSVTHDSGKSWQSQSLPRFPGLETCPCVTSASAPMFTSPRDGTFVVQASTWETTCSSQSGHAGCQSQQRPVNSAIYRTQDGGATWIATLLPRLADGGVSFINGRIGWFAGALYNPDPSFSYLNGLVFDQLYFTSNGGASWSRIATQGSMQGGTLAFVNSTTGWALKEGRLSVSNDSGRTWTTVDSFVLP